MKPVNELQFKSAQFRGNILDSVSMLEMIMDVFIATFFCRNEQRIKDMQMFMIGDNRMSLESKRQVFYAIATRYYKNWYNSFSPDKKLNKALIDIIEQRNIFAHCVLDIRSESVIKFKKTGVVSFLRFKDDVSPFYYTDETFLKLYEDILYIHYFIEEGIKSHFE